MITKLTAIFFLLLISNVNAQTQITNVNYSKVDFLTDYLIENCPTDEIDATNAVNTLQLTTIATGEVAPDKIPKANKELLRNYLAEIYAQIPYTYYSGNSSIEMTGQFDGKNILVCGAHSLSVKDTVFLFDEKPIEDSYLQQLTLQIVKDVTAQNIIQQGIGGSVTLGDVTTKIDTMETKIENTNSQMTGVIQGVKDVQGSISQNQEQINSIRTDIENKLNNNFTINILFEFIIGVTLVGLIFRSEIKNMIFNKSKIEK